MRPCTVNLNDCLINNSHLHKKLRVQHCGSLRCKTCPILDTQTKFRSTLTHREYNTFSPDVVSPLSCKSKNIIYLLSCQECGLQYIGETGRPLHQRINGHRTTVRKKENIRGRHFAKEGHNFRIKIIERLIPFQGETIRDLTARREERELFWQKELGTIWPFGLNDRVKGVGNVSKKYSKIGNSSQLINAHARPNRSHGHRKHHNKSFHDYVTVNLIKDTYGRTDGLHLLRSLLYSIPLNLLSKLQSDISALYVRKEINKSIFLIVTDISNHRLFKPVSTTNDSKKRTFIKMLYRDRGIDLINLSNILHNKKVLSFIPPYLDTSVPILSYKYTKTISSSIFNHVKTVSEFEVNRFRHNGYPCECSQSPFLSPPHGHIITGDLSIIPNEALRDLISKGPKFREQNKISWKKDKQIIMEAIKDYAKTWAKKENCDVSVLSEWINEIGSIVDRKIDKLKKQTKQPPDPVLHKPDVKACLNDLHEKYVFAPADKAANNVIIICKQFYLDVIVKELGLLNSTISSPTYQKVDYSVEQLVDCHFKYLEKFNLTFNDKFRDLPRIFAIPKLHKNPYKFRFNAESKFCSTKELTVLLAKGLVKVQEF